MSKEKSFYDALREVFVGAEIEGESGYINLMQTKARYFKEVVSPKLKDDIEDVLDLYPQFREELFDKLYDFFYRYFSESGSIYFRRTRYPQSVYEQVYTNQKDAILFWKTHMLYYVKTERLYKSLKIEVDDLKSGDTISFFFDVSELEHKKSNERRDLVYRFDHVRTNRDIVFKVEYSSHGSKTKMLDISRSLRSENVKVNENVLHRAFNIFEKQSEVDYFINKDAESFLKEQFDLWVYQYLFEGQNVWTISRIEKLQLLKEISYKIIDFIAQFENELVRIWNKPKFVKNSHYVITLDRFEDRDIELVKTIMEHDGITRQIEEWISLGIVDNDFSPDKIWQHGKFEEEVDARYKFLPIDTKYIPDLEINIISLFENLDDSIDGWLIQSENYQALKNILPRFRNKAQVIYIDPPFNTGKDFAYIDRFQDSTWLTIMENRVKFIPEFLHKSGSFLLHLDHNADFFGRLISEIYFDRNDFINDVIWHFPDNFQGNVKGFANNHQVVFWYAMSKSDLLANRVMIDLDEPTKRDVRIWSKEQQKLIAARDSDGNIKYRTYTQKKADDVWSIGQSSVTKRASSEYVDFDTQKPEELLRRLLVATSEEGSLVIDFFLGSGTTTATAHKMGRKWIGIEMDDYFSDFALPRMKEVLSGKSLREPCGISEDVEWQGGGFFKYYEMEQYEDVLSKSIYVEDADPFVNPYEDPYNQYVFLADLKQLHSVEINSENQVIQVDLDRIYKGIDLAESLANVMGKRIETLTSNEVTFSDGEKVDLQEPDWELIKPFIWW